MQKKKKVSKSSLQYRRTYVLQSSPALQQASHLILDLFALTHSLSGTSCFHIWRISSLLWVKYPEHIPRVYVWCKHESAYQDETVPRPSQPSPHQLKMRAMSSQAARGRVWMLPEWCKSCLPLLHASCRSSHVEQKEVVLVPMFFTRRVAGGLDTYNLSVCLCVPPLPRLPGQETWSGHGRAWEDGHA